MAGLVPAIHVTPKRPNASAKRGLFAGHVVSNAPLNAAAWMAGTSPAMTIGLGDGFTPAASASRENLPRDSKPSWVSSVDDRPRRHSAAENAAVLTHPEKRAKR